MIIGLTVDDPATVILAAQLLTSYPNEAAHAICDFLVHDQQIQCEADGSLPERITFIGHASPFYFGTYTPETLADYILEQLKEAAAINPKIKDSLKKLDFVACNIGAIREKGDDFLITLSKKLEPALVKEGFDLKIMGFTTQKLNAQGQKAYSSVFNLNIDEPDKPIFCYYAFTTKEDRNRAQDLKIMVDSLKKGLGSLNYSLLKVNKKGRFVHAQLKESKKLEAQCTAELEAIKSAGMKNTKDITILKKKAQHFSKKLEKYGPLDDETQRKVDAYKAKIYREYATLKTQRKGLEAEYHAKKSEQSQCQQKIAEQSSELGQLRAQKESLDAKIEAKNAQIEKTEQLLNERRIKLYETTDIRKTLDRDPYCDCSRLIKKDLHTFFKGAYQHAKKEAPQAAEENLEQSVDTYCTVAL